MNRLFLSTILLALGARALSAQGWPQTWDTPCTLDVVLVTFRDTTAARPNVSYDYHDYDLPYGYTTQGVPGNSSYRLRDFQRLLTGGYDEDGNHDEGTVFMGDTVTLQQQILMGFLPGARHRQRSRQARSPHQGTRCILRTGSGLKTVRVGPKPDQEPGNPERRAARVGEQAADAPKRVTEKRLRSISVDRAAVKKDTEPYLLQQYTNDDGVMILFTEGGLP